MFVVFEGIDGSGKTTVSNRVAARLRAAGTTVEHVREGGEFSAPLVRRLRDFGKDTRNLAMSPFTELLLYAARESQLMAESLRPALAAHPVVFADRYLYSYEVLSVYGRGMTRAEVAPILDAVSGGVWPDLVVLLDADPYVARARRRVHKIEARDDDASGGSRKGLGGVGVQHRLRDGYREMAARDPDRWLVIDNADAGLDAVVDRVVAVITAAAGGAPISPTLADARAAAQAAAPAAAAGSPTIEAARRAFWSWIETRAATEPAVAAYFLSGLDDAEAWAWRERLAIAAPAVVAQGLRGLAGETAWRLRAELAAAAPYHVARSIDGLAVEGARADAMREELVDAEPQAVLATLDGNDGDQAWRLRRTLGVRFPAQVVASTKGLDTTAAWQIREQFWAERGGKGAFHDPAVAAPLVASLRGLSSRRAWQVRRRCFDAAPVASLWSLAGVVDDDAWQWRQDWAARAGKVVLRTFDGSDDPRAWALRRAWAAAVKETLDSMVGLDTDAAWALREQCADLWPSTVYKSLGPLAATPRGAAIAAHLLARYPGNVSLLKHATHLAGGGH